MKAIAYKIFKILVTLVLIAKITNWVFHYSEEINTIINATMFTLIGIAYVVAGFIWNRKTTNLLFLVSGLYLILMSFIPDVSWKSIIGIICIVTPLFIVRFFPEKEENEPLKQH